jgi:ankyrin repeat protein
MESYSINRASNIDFMTLLIKIGTPLTERDAHGRTPLHAAAMYGYVEAAELILKTKEGLELVNAK